MSERRGLPVAVVIAAGLAWAPGCGKDADREQPPPMPAPAATAYEVCVLGDQTRVELLANIASASGAAPEVAGDRMRCRVAAGDRALDLVTTTDTRAAAHGRLTWQADVALLAVDAERGLLPVHREHVLLAAQMGAPEVVIAFTRTQRIEDVEVLERQEIEARELLNDYALPGDGALCVFDHPGAKTTPGWDAPRGPRAIVRSLARLARKRPPAEASRQGTHFHAGVYALTDEEAFAEDVAAPVRGGPAVVLVGGEEIAAEVTAAAEVPPGGYGGIELAFPRAIGLAPAQRFVLLRGDHVTAAGVFTSPQDPGRRQGPRSKAQNTE